MKSKKFRFNKNNPRNTKRLFPNKKVHKTLLKLKKTHRKKYTKRSRHRKGGGRMNQPGDVGKQCPICQEVDGEDEPKEWTTTNCGHEMHTECLRKWMDRPGAGPTATCPVCRQNLRTLWAMDNPKEYEGERAAAARAEEQRRAEEGRRRREEEARIQTAEATEERRIEALMGPLPDNLNNFIINVANGSIIKREGGEEREILMNNESGEFTDPFRLTISKAGVPVLWKWLRAIRFMVDQDGMRNVYEVVFDDEINALSRGYADQRSPMGAMFTEMTNLRRINLENIKWIGDQDNNEGIFSGLKNLRYVKFHPEALLPSEAFMASGLVEVVVPGSELMTRYRDHNAPVRMARQDPSDKVNLNYTFADCENLNKVIFPLDFDPNAAFDNTFDNCPQLRDVVMPFSLFKKFEEESYSMLLGQNTNIENITFSSHPFNVRNLDGDLIPVEIKWSGAGFDDNNLISVYDIYDISVPYTPEEEDEYIEHFNKLVNIGCKTINEYIVDQYPELGPPESFIVRGTVKIHDPVGDIYREAGMTRGTEFWGYWRHDDRLNNRLRSVHDNFVNKMKGSIEKVEELGDMQSRLAFHPSYHDKLTMEKQKMRKLLQCDGLNISIQGTGKHLSAGQLVNLTAPFEPDKFNNKQLLNPSILSYIDLDSIYLEDNPNYVAPE